MVLIHLFISKEHQKYCQNHLYTKQNPFQNYHSFLEELYIYFYLMTFRTQIKAKIKKIEKQIFTLDTNKLNYYLTLNTE